jgi:hypothetical protein
VTTFEHNKKGHGKQIHVCHAKIQSFSGHGTLCFPSYYNGIFVNLFQYLSAATMACYFAYEIFKHGIVFFPVISYYSCSCPRNARGTWLVQQEFLSAHIYIYIYNINNHTWVLTEAICMWFLSRLCLVWSFILFLVKTQIYIIKALKHRTMDWEFIS